LAYACYLPSSYRVVDAVDRHNSNKTLPRVGVINKVSVNSIDEEILTLIGSSKAVLVVESWNQKNGLGSRMGTQLLERSLTPKFKRMGTTKEGCGGLTEQIPYQGLDPQSIMAEIAKLTH
jgi:transketolase C-terminal domain/subunit